MDPKEYPNSRTDDYDNDPFTNPEALELDALPVQRATISTETSNTCSHVCGAETEVVFPDGQAVSVTVTGPAFVTIELPVYPKPEPKPVFNFNSSWATISQPSVAELDAALANLARNLANRKNRK